MGYTCCSGLDQGVKESDAVTSPTCIASKAIHLSVCRSLSLLLETKRVQTMNTYCSVKANCIIFSQGKHFCYKKKKKSAVIKSTMMEMLRVTYGVVLGSKCCIAEEERSIIL